MEPLLRQLDKLVLIFSTPTPDVVLGPPTRRVNGLSDWEGKQLDALGPGTTRACLVRVPESRTQLQVWFPLELVTAASLDEAFAKGRKVKNRGLRRTWTCAGIKRHVFIGQEGVAGEPCWKLTIDASAAELEGAVARAAVTAVQPPQLYARSAGAWQVEFAPAAPRDVSGATLAFERFITSAPTWLARGPFDDAVAAAGGARHVVPLGANAGEAGVVAELHQKEARLVGVSVRVDFNDVDRTGIDSALFNPIAAAWKKQASALARQWGLDGRATKTWGEWEGSQGALRLRLEFDARAVDGAEGSYGSASVRVGTA